MKTSTIALCLAMAVLCPAATAYAESKYQITDAERSACQGDAVNFCSAAFPDEDALLACMKLNVAKLTIGCRSVFIEGLRRRLIR